jgi:hypothetical protein
MNTAAIEDDVDGLGPIVRCREVKFTYVATAAIIRSVSLDVRPIAEGQSRITWLLGVEIFEHTSPISGWYQSSEERGSISAYAGWEAATPTPATPVTTRPAMIFLIPSGRGVNSFNVSTLR